MASELVVVERAKLQAVIDGQDIFDREDRFVPLSSAINALRDTLSAEAVQGHCKGCGGWKPHRTMDDVRRPVEERRCPGISLPQPGAGERACDHSNPCSGCIHAAVQAAQKAIIDAHEPAAQPDVGVAEWLHERAKLWWDDHSGGPLIMEVQRVGSLALREAADEWTRQHPPDAGAGEPRPSRAALMELFEAAEAVWSHREKDKMDRYVASLERCVIEARESGREGEKRG